MPRLRATRITAIAHAARQMLASVFAGASAVYSTRIPACSTYDGPLQSVRRSTDGAQADIYASPRGYSVFDRWLDTTALLAHCGSGSGFVVTWYDISGNARNATQATAANQPRIVNAGVLQTMGGRPTVVFDGINDFFSVAYNSSAMLAAGSINTVSVPESNALVYTAQIAWSNGVPAAPGFGQTSPNTSFGVYGTFSPNRVTASVTLNAPLVATGTWTGSGATTKIYFQGNAAGTGSVSLTQSIATMWIGQDTNTFYKGQLSEVALLTYELSTTARLALERSQGTAFGIAVA